MNKTKRPIKAATYRKKRSDCRLNRLKPEEQEQVFAYCESVKLKEAVVWLKAQLNITLSTHRLSAWLRSQRVARASVERLEEIRDASESARLVGEAAGQVAELNDANIALIAQATFQEFLKKPEDRNPKLMTHYMQFALRAKGLDLKESMTDLAWQKHFFDAAGKALACAAELKAIKDSEDEERRKIERAVVLLFGERPTEYVVDVPSIPDAESGGAAALPEPEPTETTAGGEI